MGKQDGEGGAIPNLRDPDQGCVQFRAPPVSSAGTSRSGGAPGENAKGNREHAPT